MGLGGMDTCHRTVGITKWGWMPLPMAAGAGFTTARMAWEVCHSRANGNPGLCFIRMDPRRLLAGMTTRRWMPAPVTGRRGKLYDCGYDAGVLSVSAETSIVSDSN